MKLLNMYKLEKISNLFETITARQNSYSIRDFALQFGRYILSRDLHAILFRPGVDTQISHEWYGKRSFNRLQNLNESIRHDSFNKLKKCFTHRFLQNKECMS